MTKRIQSPDFPGIAKPSIDFEFVRDQRRSTLLYYDIDLSTARSFAAGTQLTLPLVGNAFYVDADLTDGGTAIAHFQDSVNAGSAPVYVSPGFIAQVPFTQIVFENAAQSGKLLRFFYGVDIDFTPGQTSQTSISGSVSVIDGGLGRTALNQAFTAFPSLGPTVGQYNHAQLWNPAASGKNLIVEKISIMSSAAAIVEIGMNATNLSTFDRFCTSKLAGGAASVGKSYYQSNAALLLPPADRRFVYSVAANDNVIIELREPFIVPQGFGVTVQQDTVNLSLYTNMEFFEQSV